MTPKQSFDEYKAFRTRKTVSMEEDEQEESRVVDQLSKLIGAFSVREDLIWLVEGDKYETFKTKAEEILASERMLS